MNRDVFSQASVGCPPPAPCWAFVDGQQLRQSSHTQELTLVSRSQCSKWKLPEDAGTGLEGREERPGELVAARVGGWPGLKDCRPTSPCWPGDASGAG